MELVVYVEPFLVDVNRAVYTAIIVSAHRGTPVAKQLHEVGEGETVDAFLIVLRVMGIDFVMVPERRLEQFEAHVVLPRAVGQ